VDLARLVELIVEKGRERGVDEVEAYAVQSTATEIHLVSRGVVSITSGSRVGIGIRCVVGKRVAVVGGEVSEESEALKLLDKCISIAHSLERDEKWVSLAKDLGAANTYPPIDRAIALPDIAKLVDYAESLLATQTGTRFVDQGGVSAGYGARCIANSYGGPLCDERTHLEVFATFRVVKNGEAGFFSDYSEGRTLEDIDISDFAAKGYEIAEKSIGARSIDTGVYEVVLAPKVFASILQAVIAPAISALNVQMGRSPLAGKRGSKVLAEQITLIDDGSSPKLVASRRFDDEGVATRRTIVVEKGVLSTYLYDTYTANIDGVESTGSAHRESLSSQPLPSYTNLLMIPGSARIDDVVADMKRGLVVYSVIGQWMSNFVSGMVSATVVNAIYIESGRELHPVKGVVLGGNIYELLSDDNIAAVGAEVDHFAAIYTPFVYLRRMSVAGR